MSAAVVRRRAAGCAFAAPSLALLTLLLLPHRSALAAPAQQKQQQQQPKPQPLGFADAERGKELRVLAFGDSLTEGWTGSTGRKTPYSWNLEARLRARLAPRGIGVSVVNAGIGSKGVLDALNDAWYARLREARDAGRRYQYIIFLAGINDILIQ